MTSLGLAAIVHLSLVVTGADSYAEAYRVTSETGRPLVIVIGAEWCPACQVLEKTVMPVVRDHGGLDKVAYAAIDLDHERELGTQLTAGGPIPQLLMYRKTASGWKVRRIIGAYPVATIEAFINEGVAMDEETKKAEASQATQPTAPASASPRTASQGEPSQTRG